MQGTRTNLGATLLLLYVSGRDGLTILYESFSLVDVQKTCIGGWVAESDGIGNVHLSEATVTSMCVKAKCNVSRNGLRRRLRSVSSI